MLLLCLSTLAHQSLVLAFAASTTNRHHIHVMSLPSAHAVQELSLGLHLLLFFGALHVQAS
jgi:hypothetical protein